MSGTTSARMGVCRPTIEPRVPRALASESRGSSLTPEAMGASVTIGIARAPKATGAVLATRATVAALTGSKPSDISITTEIATGVPKPASASRRAPKQKAMMIAWIRWSGLTFSKERRSTSKCPDDTVRL
jgi:hypothetical protein